MKMAFRSILLFAVLLPLVSAQQPDPFQPTLGGMVAEELQQAVRAFTDSQAAIGNANVRLQQTRERYWKAFPSASDRAAAEPEFRKALFAKDLFYLAMSVPEGFNGRLAGFFDLFARLDGGIRPAALPAFRSVVNAIRYELGARGQNDAVFFNPARVGEWMVQNTNLFAAYIRARDFAEFQGSGLDLKRYLRPSTYALLLIEYRLALQEVDPGIKPPNLEDEASKVYAAMVSAVGETSVLAAAEQVLNGSKDAEGNLTSAVRVENIEGETVETVNPFFWFEGLLDGSSGSRGYAAALVRPVPGDYTYRWTDTAKTIKGIVEAYGEPRVLLAADQVRKTPRVPGGRIRMEDGSFISAAGLFRRIVAPPDGQFPTDPTYPTFEATDVDNIKQRAGGIVGGKVLKPQITYVRGVVSRATWDAVGARRGTFFTLHFQGVPDDQVVVRFLNARPQFVESAYGTDGRNLIGKTVEALAVDGPQFDADGRQAIIYLTVPGTPDLKILK